MVGVDGLIISSELEDVVEVMHWARNWWALSKEALCKSVHGRRMVCLVILLYKGS